MPSRKKHKIKHAEVVRRFAVKLKEVRLSRGLTQAQLAEKAHVTVSYLSRLESEGSSPGLDLLDRLAKALAVTIAELVQEMAPPDPIHLIQEQARRLIESIIESGSRDTLSVLLPLLARLAESASRVR